MTQNQLEFHIISADKIRITGHGGSDCRLECAAEILTDLVLNAPEHLVGKRGGVWFCDGPPLSSWIERQELPFSTTKLLEAKSATLPFPCPLSLRWPQVGIPNAERLLETLLKNETTFSDPRMFWIGADTHISRKRLVQLGQQFPQRLDAELMQWDRKATGGQRSKSRQVSIPEHQRYKYLIDCPGYGYSARLKWLLATGRPVFVIERNVVEHWHDKLEPWVHFVPVDKDLSNLFEHWERLESDPALYDFIGRSAKLFAARHLSIEAMLRESLLALDSASPSLRPLTTASPEAETRASLTIIRFTEGLQKEQFMELLGQFLASTSDFIWIMDQEVFFDRREDEFLKEFATVDVDLLATDVRSYIEDPGWNWWPGLSSPNATFDIETGVAALLPLIRLSRPAALAIVKGIEDGWEGHLEALVPTLVGNSGLKIEDIGGGGSFTPAERMAKWYIKKSWHWQKVQCYTSGKLHYPVTLQIDPFPKGRVFDPTDNVDPKILFASPVGADSVELLPAVLECFMAAGAECLLLQYDSAELPVPPGVHLIRDSGAKWQLAQRHLTPEYVSAYDYIFYWDDDLSLDEFDPVKFTEIMRLNRLDVAQPAILSPHSLSHQITGHRSCPAPWRSSDGNTFFPVVGRLTNFVEIMAPVFTRDAWTEIYGYIEVDDVSGWGLDYVPFARKGIVDSLPVTHTRAVRSINPRSESELKRFLSKNGLIRYRPVEQALLFSSPQRGNPIK